MCHCKRKQLYSGHAYSFRHRGISVYGSTSVQIPQPFSNISKGYTRVIRRCHMRVQFYLPSMYGLMLLSTILITKKICHIQLRYLSFSD